SPHRGGRAVEDAVKRPLSRSVPRKVSHQSSNKWPEQLVVVRAAGLPDRGLDSSRPKGRRRSLGGPALNAGSDRSVTHHRRLRSAGDGDRPRGHVTVTQGSAPGSLTLFASGSSNPGTSTIDYSAGQTRANNAVVPLNGSGGLTVHCGQTSGTVHFILDVNGYFQKSRELHARPPAHPAAVRAPMNASIRSSRSGSVTVPPDRRWSWKARMSNRGPRACSAFCRSSRILSSPILYESACAGQAM